MNQEFTNQEKIDILEHIIWGAIAPELAEEEKKIIDGQHPFFSKKHYYDEHGNVTNEY